MDKTYWTEYYKNSEPPKEASLFAQWVFSSLKKEPCPNLSFLELGCGNGRDSIYFAQNSISVTAIDQVDEIHSLSERFSTCQNLKFIQEDFIDFPRYLNEEFDCIYSRFTLHSISEQNAEILFKHVLASLKIGGKFFIEVRSINDDIFGKGEMVKGERNAFIYNDHYRRFLVLDELKRDLEENGFIVLYAEESKEFAPYKDEKPAVIRIVATR